MLFVKSSASSYANIFFASLFLSISSFTIAAPWISPDDLSLRNDIQLLADAGVIKAPVTTYPLMWQAIISDVNTATLSSLPSIQQEALSNIKKAYQHVHASQSRSKVNVYGSTTEKRFTSFGTNNVDKANIEIAFEHDNDWFSGQLQGNYRAGLDHAGETLAANKFNLDESYLALKLGNWIISGGSTDRWWGPTVNSNLMMSTNARPLPAITLSRNKSTAFETPLLSWLGQWTLTTQMAQLEKERYIPKALLWSSRGTLRPIRGLELGASWSLQWAGEGQPSSFSDFIDAVSGKKTCANGAPTCDPELNTYLGNQLAGFDIRWSDTFFSLPYALYAQQIGEDGSPNNGIVTDKGEMFGAEIRFSAFEQHLFLNVEYADTQVACSGESTTLNCYYEHGTYHSGYRYNRRTIGSTYDNDAEVISATLLGQLASGNRWQVKVNFIELNTDNIDRYPNDPLLGNTVSKIAESVQELDGQYHFSALKSEFTLGALVSNNEIGTSSDLSIDAYFSWKYQFDH